LSDAKVDTQGRLVMLGYCDSSHLAISRLLSDGRLDTAFGQNGSATDPVPTGEFYSIVYGDGPARCEAANPHGGRIFLLEGGAFLVVSPTASSPVADEIGVGCNSAALGIGFFQYEESGKLKSEYRPDGFLRTWHQVPYDPAKVTLITRTDAGAVLAVLALGGDSYRVVGDPRPATYFVRARITP
jgi:hypothetical protein